MDKLTFRMCAWRIILICAVVFCSLLVQAQDYSSRIRNLQTDRAYQKLLHANIFNFGGIGFASAITPEEKAFDTLLQSRNSIGLFKRLLSEANPEGQLYALYGLHLEDPDAFNKEAEKLKLGDGPPARREEFIPVGKGKVRVGSGCLLFQQDRRAVIEEIARGKFDQAFRSNDRRLIY